MKPAKFNPMTSPMFYWSEWKRKRMIWPRKINGRRYWFRMAWRRTLFPDMFAIYRETRILVMPGQAAWLIKHEWRLFVPHLVRPTEIVTGSHT